jgi:hypothetical protein
MEADRGRNVKNYTADELVKLIDQSMKATAQDVREGRVPLDGRIHLPKRESEDKPLVPDAAE